VFFVSEAVFKVWNALEYKDIVNRGIAKLLLKSRYVTMMDE